MITVAAPVCLIVLVTITKMELGSELRLERKLTQSYYVAKCRAIRYGANGNNEMVNNGDLDNKVKDDKAS